MKRIILVYAVCVLAGFATCCITEDEIRKMKIKELKEFLDQRDEGYTGCVEKSDLIRAAIKVKDKKVSPDKEKLKGYTGEYPNKKFWDFWSEESLRLESVNKLTDKSRKIMLDVVEACFMQHGKSVATRLKKNPDDLLKTSLKSPYYQAGLRGLNKLITLYASNTGFKNGDVRDACEKIFIPWITNVGIENTNLMYEILDKNDVEL